MNLLRPLSPHLPIYKPQLTSTFPISHRISGAFLATIVFFFYLLCLKMGLICFTYENFYQFFFYSSKLILISVEITALALSYHLYNGIRHLLTDFSGFLFWKKKIEMTVKNVTYTFSSERFKKSIFLFL
nr:succinate dehydrogenase subunit 3 [Panax notoginseng]UBT67842.1 succinate dehydrogenase subunit 3 [Panax notoginseng]UBT67861.1 succinate dehydrogenase subunit 3 [Panax notoginseng]UBT67870.1 succinate dehydrogenase subunit 3 [Panax notoginseng]UBT67876.1 succinate dehydrogenase subunit 3 [Panax notoginseng]